MNADLRLEYVNQQDTPIDKRMLAVKIRRLRKAFSGLNLFHQKDGAANVKYVGRNRVQFFTFYVVCVSRP